MVNMPDNQRLPRRAADVAMTDKQYTLHRTIPFIQKAAKESKPGACQVLFLGQFEVALKYQFENVIEHQSTVEVHAAQADFFLHGVDRVVG